MYVYIAEWLVVIAHCTALLVALQASMVVGWVLLFVVAPFLFQCVCVCVFFFAFICVNLPREEDTGIIVLNV